MMVILSDESLVANGATKAFPKVHSDDDDDDAATLEVGT
jgi:hypothetical protein